MTIYDLMEDAQSLMKPSLLLDEEPSDMGVVGYWGGSGRKKINGPQERSHWLTVDCSWLSRHGFSVQGCLGVYEVDNEVYQWNNPFFTDYEPDTKLSDFDFPESLPLYGHEASSFPPFEALCLYGGLKVEEWLQSISCQRIDYDLAGRNELGSQYIYEWLDKTPFMSNKHAVVLGGWHQLWPEDDFYIPREMELLIWTFRNSEPWLEVRKRRQNIQVKNRIT